MTSPKDLEDSRNLATQFLDSSTGYRVELRFTFVTSSRVVPQPLLVRLSVMSGKLTRLSEPPLKGSQRILGMPDASYHNNNDKSSQRAHVIFLAEDRKLPSKGTYRNSGYDKQAHRIDGSNSATRGSIIDYESHKITTTTQSTTVAELNALMKCFGTCLFLRALWADISGEIVPIHIRTDANNLVTTAQTTHLPEQKETHHLIQMLRHESNSGHLT